MATRFIDKWNWSTRIKPSTIVTNMLCQEHIDTGYRWASKIFFHRDMSSLYTLVCTVKWKYTNNPKFVCWYCKYYAISSRKISHSKQNQFKNSNYSYQQSVIPLNGLGNKHTCNAIIFLSWNKSILNTSRCVQLTCM